MNPDTVTFLVGLAMLAIGIIGTDALTRRARRAKDDEHAAIVAAKDDTIAATEARADVMEASAESLASLLLEARRERDLYQTAFQAEMLRQARAELLRPDEASGLATVHEIKAGRA